MNRFIESRIFHILCTLTDLVVLNLLYVLCCIPVVTIGAATTALYGTVLAPLADRGCCRCGRFNHRGTVLEPRR